LILSPLKENGRIESRTIGSWREFESFDCTSETSFEAIREAGIDSIEAEEFGRFWRKEKGLTYLVGKPWLEQGNTKLETDMNYFGVSDRTVLFG
jgi:hypothetical protein